MAPFRKLPLLSSFLRPFLQHLPINSRLLFRPFQVLLLFFFFQREHRGVTAVSLLLLLDAFYGGGAIWCNNQRCHSHVQFSALPLSNSVSQKLRVCGFFFTGLYKHLALFARVQNALRVLFIPTCSPFCRNKNIGGGSNREREREREKEPFFSPLCASDFP